MVDKISVEIALEGGAEVEQQLDSISKTGQKAFGELQSASEQLDFSAIASGFQEVGDTGVQAFDKIRTAVKSAAVFEQIIQGAQRVEGAFDALGNAAIKLGSRLTRSLGALGVVARALGPIGIAVGVAGGALVKFGDDSADAINKLTASSAKLDLTAQNFDTLQKALTQAGISSDTILPGLEKLKESLSKDFFQTDVITGLRNFIAQLERMPDGAERTKLAMERLGEGLGAQVIAGLQTGTLTAQNFATALAGIAPVTQQQIVEAAKYQQSLNQLNSAWNEFKSTVAAPVLAPVFQFITGEIENLKNGFEGARASYQTLKALLQEDFSLPWLLKIVNFDPNLMLSKWQPVLQALQTMLNSVGISTPGLDGLVLKAQAATQALQQTGQAGAQAGAEAAQGLQLVANPLTGLPELVNGTNQALQQTGQTAAQAGQQGAQGFQQVDTAAQQTLERIQAVNAANTGIDWSSISTVGVAAWNALTAAIGNAIDKLLQFMGLKPSAPATGAGASGMARGGLLGGRGTGTSDSNLAWLSRGEHIMPASVVRRPGVLAFLEALRRSGRIPGFAEGGPVGGAGGGDASRILRAVFASLENAIQAMNTIMDPLHNNLAEVIRSIGAIESALGTAMNGVAGTIIGAMRTLSDLIQRIEQQTRGAARGGLLGGRGTGTSDSNLAWVSRGEYITPARAVRQPGVLAFLEALRRSGGDLHRVLDGMGRFALGGMVPRAIPAFAGGGLAGANLGTLTLGLPSGGSVSVRASTAVVEQLRKEAALAQVRSGGRKPSRYS